ncbi:MAG: O-antigen ligase family protein [Gammaproteobacteria bacterium]|nr:O-antigen ligase family protein [Gammaproteobacteria bacterium]
MLMFSMLVVFHGVSAIVANGAGVYLVDPRQLDGHFDVARGWFVNRNHFAAFMLLCSVGGISAVLPERQDSVKVLVKVAAAVMLTLVSAAIIMSQSRAALGCLLLLPVLIVLLLQHLRGCNGLWWIRKRQSYLLAGALLGLVLLVLALNFGGELVRRILHGGLGIGERGLQWQVTWQAISDRLIVGHGGGSYASVFQAYRGDAELRQVVFDQAHNDYLHIWLEQGLIGLTLWLAFIALAFKSGWQALHNTRSSLIAATLASGLCITLFALLQSFVDFNLQIVNLRSYFFVIIALLLAVPTLPGGSRTTNHLKS